MPVTKMSVPDLLWHRAEQANATRYAHIGYCRNRKGGAEILTWAQLYPRVGVIAEEPSTCKSPDNRRTISMPHGPQYGVERYRSGAFNQLDVAV